MNESAINCGGVMRTEDRIRGLGDRILLVPFSLP